MTEREAFIVLNRIEGLGPVTTRRLIETLGSADAVLSADAEMLKETPKVGDKIANAIVKQRAVFDVSAELALAEELGVKIVTQADDDYPSCLRNMYDPPLAL